MDIENHVILYLAYPDPCIKSMNYIAQENRKMYIYTCGNIFTTYM